MMKQTKYFLPILSLFFIFSCSTDDKVIDQVLDGVTNGAVLRTLSVNNAILNSSDPSTEFSVTVEEQDEQDGDLLESVDIFVSISDGSPDNGVTVVNDAFVKTIPASDFTDGPHGLPRATLTATFGEAEAAMGLTSADHAPGDVFVFELRVNLTDGRTFGAAQAAGVITGGFFSSPYLYNTLILCSPQPGVYRIDMHDSYGDGWQSTTGNGGGPPIIVSLNGGTDAINVGMCTIWEEPGYDCVDGDGFEAVQFITIAEGTEEAVWNFTGDNWGEISFEVYFDDGNILLFESGGPGATGAGLLPITLCAE